MKKRFIFFAWKAFVVLSVCMPVSILAQTTQSDSVKQKQDEKIRLESVEGEMVLGTIEIRGKVDKPGVIIMPKRVEPEIGEMELERSFKKELSEGVGEIPKPEKALRRLDTVKSIKKTVERERK